MGERMKGSRDGDGVGERSRSWYGNGVRGRNSDWKGMGKRRRRRGRVFWDQRNRVRKRRWGVRRRGVRHSGQVNDGMLVEGRVGVRLVVSWVDREHGVGAERVGVGGGIRQQQVGLRQQVRLQAGDGGKDWRDFTHISSGEGSWEGAVEGDFGGMVGGDEGSSNNRRRMFMVSNRAELDRVGELCRVSRVGRTLHERTVGGGDGHQRLFHRREGGDDRLRRLRQRGDDGRGRLRHRHRVARHRDGLHHRLEPVDAVRRVGDRPDASVGVHEGVLPAHDVAVARLRVRLLVARQRVAHTVLVLEVRAIEGGRVDRRSGDYGGLAGDGGGGAGASCQRRGGDGHRGNTRRRHLGVVSHLISKKEKRRPRHLLHRQFPHGGRHRGGGEEDGGAVVIAEGDVGEVGEWGDGLCAGAHNHLRLWFRFRQRGALNAQGRG